MFSVAARWRWRRRFRGLAALLLLIALAIAAWTSLPPTLLTVPLVQVMDGDSLTIRRHGARAALRLQGIDAVEYHQDCGGPLHGARWACGREARAALERLAGRGPLHCELGSKDRYGRTLATCRTAPHPDGVELNAEMARLGFAIATGDDYLMAEAEARAARRGIWQGDFTPPAEWRAVHGRASDAASTPGT